jgi:hypothetical protein
MAACSRFSVNLGKAARKGKSTQPRSGAGFFVRDHEYRLSEAVFRRQPPKSENFDQIALVVGAYRYMLMGESRFAQSNCSVRRI